MCILPRKSGIAVCVCVCVWGGERGSRWWGLAWCIPLLIQMNTIHTSPHPLHAYTHTFPLYPFTHPPSFLFSLPLSLFPLHSPTLTCGGDPVDTRGGQVDLRVIKVGQLKIKPKLERKEGERGERESVTTTTTLSNQTSLTVLGRGNLFVQRCRLQNSWNYECVSIYWALHGTHNRGATHTMKFMVDKTPTNQW